MKKLIFSIVFFFSTLALNAQYSTINAIIQRLEEKRGINQNLSDVDIDNRKFVLIKDFEDHTERSFIIINGNLLTYVEMFDDKKTGESSSNVFTGDIIPPKSNLISMRADKLEGIKIPLPVTKTLLMTKQKKFLYLIDINTKERWIEEAAINQK